MTREPTDEYGERLRRALNAEADQVMPSRDALHRIQSRIDTVGEHVYRVPGSSRTSRFLTTWWRPLMAAAAAAVVALLAVNTPVKSLLTSPSGDSGRVAGAASQSINGSGSNQFGSGHKRGHHPSDSPHSTPSEKPSTRPSPSHTCLPASVPSASSPTPTPTPTPSRTPTATPTPSPTPSTSSGGQSGDPCPSQSASKPPATMPSTDSPRPTGGSPVATKTP